MAGDTLDFDNPQQPSRQLAANLRGKITSGELAVGDQLPSVRELAKTYDVAIGTVQQALRQLRDEGLVVTWQGRGTYVTSRQPASESGVDAQVIMQRLDEVLGRVESLENKVADLEQTREKPRPRRRPEK
jgi:DNA-binding GntR family transcriptional regulator